MFFHSYPQFVSLSLSTVNLSTMDSFLKHPTQRQVHATQVYYSISHAQLCKRRFKAILRGSSNQQGNLIKQLAAPRICNGKFFNLGM